MSSRELPTRYDPGQVEPRWVAVWDEQKLGRADEDSAAARDGRTFAIMIPPPNVTGALHMGHALNNTLQDITARQRRMMGFETLWLPGSDHAGIATQAVVEKKLYREQGVTREQLGRDAFIEKVWEWKETYGSRIFSQFSRMGCSFDKDREQFTLNEELSRAVRESFVRLWEKGLIYRGARIVNWDCVLRTAVSDDELEKVTRPGKLWELRYPVKDEPGRFVTVATTRPETMLGDTGVAVHPDDARYADLVGKTLVLPLMDREIPLVADDSVEADYGTGAVKVTPGHDPADYERGVRHNLPIINLLNDDGTLNDDAGAFAGQTREDARKHVLAALDDLGLLGDVKEIEHTVPISDRSKTPIEPIVSEQWWVRMSELAGPAIAAAKDGTLTFVPERWSKVYLDWLENVQDWCISRQLWWGHRIPVWYDEDNVPVASRDDLEIGSPHPETGKPIVRQDDDVLDTWASSWLWPFATLGWPDRTPDLDRFYPTQFLSTARDIIYLWVARMVMAGYAFLDHLPMEQRCPFSVCYIHANVLDAQGRRMSKSLGNGIDPDEMIDQYGADGMRFTLAWLTNESQDLKLDPVRFEMGRNFVNKLWNAARFTLLSIGDAPLADVGPATVEDRWIRTELSRAFAQVQTAYADYKFSAAAQGAYEFVWHAFCDWYLELVKPRLAEGGQDQEAARATLAHVLAGICRMLHPITPFVTEEIWSHLRPGGGLLARADWGEETFDDGASVDTIAAVREVIGAVRNLRAESRVPEKETVDVFVRLDDGHAALASELSAQAPQFARLAKASSLTAGTDVERPAESAASPLPFGEVSIDLAGKRDLAGERARLTKQLEKARQALASCDRKLANPQFTDKAPEAVVARERAKREENAATVAQLEGLLSDLGGAE